MNGSAEKFPKSGLSDRQIKTLVYGGIITLLILGMLLSWGAVKAKDAMLRHEILHQAFILSRTIKAEWIKEMKGTEADLGTPLYERLKKHMAISRDINDYWEWLYVMGKNEQGDIFFYLDSEPDSDTDASPAGQIYPEASEELKAVFETGEAFVEGPLTDSWGVWISPIIPIKDPKTDEVLGVFGIDISAQNWRKNTAIAAIFPAASTLMMIIILLSAYHLISKRRTTKQEKRFLYKNAEALFIFATGILFTLVTLHMLTASENRQKRENFHQMSEYLSVFLLNELHTITYNDLERLARAAENSHGFSETDFKRYTKSLSNNEAVWAWGIIHHDLPADKIDLKAAKILYQTPADHKFFEIEPAMHQTAMEKAGRERLITATEILNTTEGKALQAIYRPIFDFDEPQRLLGFAFCVLDFQKLICKAKIFENQRNQKFWLDLYHLKIDEDISFIASLQGSSQAKPETNHTLFQPVFVADQTLLAAVYPNPQLIFVKRFGSSWFVALAGLVMSLALTFTVRRNILEKEVQNRTFALQESAKRYRALFENFHTVMMIIDPEDGQILDVNPAAEKFYGWSRQAFTEKYISDINTLQPDEIQNEMAQALTGEKNHFVFQHRLANDSIRQVEIYSSVVQIQNKQLLYTIVHDISERLEFEKALKSSESRLRKQRLAIATLALDETMINDEQIEPALNLITRIIATALNVQRAGIWMLNEDSSQLVCHSLWDAAFRTHSKGEILLTSSYPAYFEAITNQSLLSANDARHDPRTKEMKAPYLLPAGIYAMLDAAIHKNGKLAGVVCLEHTGETRPWHSDEEAFVSTIAAMTGQYFANIDRKKAEANQEKLQNQLAQAQKMESVGRLAGGVAHDFNNMLSVITGFTDIALQESKLSASLASYLHEIRKAAVRSADLTRQLLAFARKQTVDVKIVNINSAVEEMLKMLRRLIGENINLIWKPGDFTWNIAIDPIQLDQILANLCVNARDAIEDTGHIYIETGTKTIDQNYSDTHLDISPGEYVVLTVSDNGTGIDKETLKHLFEPFYTTKKVGQGTGLGLATVYGIVRQNNGAISVYSEPGKGSAFRIYLPRYTGEAAPAHSPEQPAPPMADENITILLVEDEASILLMAETILQRSGYQIFSAENPHQALEISLKHPQSIHLLISDIILPDMNGRQLSEKIKENQTQIRTLFMSGYTENVIAHHGVLEKGVNFIEKPFTMEGLLNKVRAILNHKS
jgi:PAS domain S-box-containing protein